MSGAYDTAVASAIGNGPLPTGAAAVAFIHAYNLGIAAAAAGHGAIILTQESGMRDLHIQWASGWHAPGPDAEWLEAPHFRRAPLWVRRNGGPAVQVTGSRLASCVVSIVRLLTRLRRTSGRGR